MRTKKVIGRLEHASFPEFGIHNLPAKIDTGAYTSSLHCSFIKEIDKGIHFVIQHLDGDTQLEKEFVTSDYKLKRIKSSNGKSQLRYVIKTKVMIGNSIYKSEFSLSNRSKLKYPVLIGRKLLRGKFVVDVSHTFYIGSTIIKN